MPDSPAPSPEVYDADAASHAESITYKDSSRSSGRSSSPLKIALIAAASALAAGLATAWYYRRTVSLLQNPPEALEDSNFGIFGASDQAEAGDDFDPEI